MDPNRFDAVARLASGHGSRRALLGAFAGALLAAAGLGEAAAAAKRAVGDSCKTNHDCASNLCVKESRTRKICHCVVDGDCPAPADATCSAVACQAGACVTTATGAAGCSCTPDLPYFSDAAHYMPIGPGTGCAADLVCDAGQQQSLGGGVQTFGDSTGICRTNHVSAAAAADFKHPWQFDCVPVTLFSRDPDKEHFLQFRVVAQPQNGFISPTEAPFPVGGLPAGTAIGLPAPPLPADVPLDCWPRCLYSDLSTCSIDNVCADCTGGGDTVFCPEATYIGQTACYVPFSPNFAGTDAFSYSVIDAFGAESEPVTVTITVFEA